MTKKSRNERPVRDWFGMGIALVQLIAAIVNAVFNYQLANARKMGT